MPNRPHGGELKDRCLGASARAEARAAAGRAKSWTLTRRQLCDLELLLNGAFSPLEGFMGPDEYAGVLRAMRLPGGLLWPVPVTLDVSEAFAAALEPGETIALRDAQGLLAAVMEVAAAWRPELTEEARAVYGTVDDAHPGVFRLVHRTHPVYVGGRVSGVDPVAHHDHRALRHSPAGLRALFRARGWRRVAAFQTRNPLHRAHVEIARRAARDCEAGLVLHPVAEPAMPGDLDRFVRMRCYEAVLPRFPEGTTVLSLLNLAMRMAGPREALWHAIVRKNHGCSHFIVGRDHAGPGADGNGRPFHGPYDAQALVAAHERELGIAMVPFEELVWVESRAAYLPAGRVADGDRALRLSGAELRRRLALGLDLPGWFTYPEVAAELRRACPPRHRQGFAVLFTGLSGAGKSTLAHGVAALLRERTGRPVTLLDGDAVRETLSGELGFSRADRATHLRRVGFVAAEVARHGGIALCALIAPWAADRRALRESVEAHGGFVEVHVSTPLEICEARDSKGLYARARAGLLEGFTGIDDPWEAPERPDLAVDTADTAPDAAARRVLATLERLGYVGAPAGRGAGTGGAKEAAR